MSRLLTTSFHWLACACLLALIGAPAAPGGAAVTVRLPLLEPSGARPLQQTQQDSFDLVSHYTGSYHDIALGEGGIAYLGDTLGLRALDVSDPAQPVEIGFLPTGGAIVDVELAGSTAYLADFSNGLRIVNISDPAHPQVLGNLATPAPPDDVAIQGNYAYVACWTGGLRVVDISDPAHPQDVWFYAQPGVSGLAKGVAVDGNYAYVLNTDIDAHDSGVWVFDITDPTDVTLAGNFDIPGADFQDLAIRGDILYAAEASIGLRLLDISDPLAIHLLGAYPAGNSHAVTVEGDWVYLTIEDPGGAGLGGVTAFYAADPLALVAGGFYSLPRNSAGIAAQGDLVFAPRDLDGGLFILRHTGGFAAFGQALLPNQAPLAGIMVQVSQTLTVTSGAEGVYRFDALAPGDYTFTPQFPASCAVNPCVFTPSTRSASLPPSQGGLNFTLLPTPLFDTLRPSEDSILVYTDTLGLATMFEFPMGTVDSTSVVMITPTLATPGSGYAFTGHAFEVGVYAFNGWDIDLDFSAPVTATISYTPDDVRLVADESQLQLGWWDGSAWRDAASTCDPPSTADHDLSNRRYALPVCKSGLYALFGPSWGVYLPFVRR
jgi:hypothetical protein